MEDMIYNNLIKSLEVLEQKYRNSPDGLNDSDLDVDYSSLRSEIQAELHRYNCTESQKKTLKRRIDKIKFDYNLYDEDPERNMMFPND